ncbi:MAG: hypothetical protein ACRD1T_24325 [Acidimicrobiia bacterium]
MQVSAQAGAEQVSSLLREVSDTLMLLIMAGLTLAGYVGLALILVGAIRALGAGGS